MNQARRLRLALDQNFPTPLISAVRPYLPPELDVASLREIDPGLSDLDDRSLIVALSRRGWDALITNNYKMLDVPEEIGAIISTKLTVIAVVGLGHDPLRAVGAFSPNCLRSSRASDRVARMSSGLPIGPETRKTVGST